MNLLAEDMERCVGMNPEPVVGRMVCPLRESCGRYLQVALDRYEKRKTQPIQLCMNGANQYVPVAWRTTA